MQTVRSRTGNTPASRPWSPDVDPWFQGRETPWDVGVMARLGNKTMGPCMRGPVHRTCSTARKRAVLDCLDGDCEDDGHSKLLHASKCRESTLGVEYRESSVGRRESKVGGQTSGVVHFSIPHKRGCWTVRIQEFVTMECRKTSVQRFPNIRIQAEEYGKSGFTYTGLQEHFSMRNM